MSKVTVQQMIDSLKHYDLNANFEICVQTHTQGSIAWVSPDESSWKDNLFATCKNGQDVRIEITLPEGMSIVQRKSKTPSGK